MSSGSILGAYREKVEIALAWGSVLAVVAAIVMNCASAALSNTVLGAFDGAFAGVVAAVGIGQLMTSKKPEYLILALNITLCASVIFGSALCLHHTISPQMLGGIAGGALVVKLISVVIKETFFN